MNGYTSMTTHSAHDPKICPICTGIREYNDQQKESTVTTTTAPSSLSQLLADIYGYGPVMQEPQKTVKAATPEEIMAKEKAKAERELYERRRAEDGERVWMGTAATAVEISLRKLPMSPNGLAGFLQGAGHKGDKSGVGNALAVYLQAEVDKRMTLPKALYSYMKGIHYKVFVESNGLIIESKRLQLCIDPPYWQRSFVEQLRRGDYPELLK